MKKLSKRYVKIYVKIYFFPTVAYLFKSENAKNTWLLFEGIFHSYLAHTPWPVTKNIGFTGALVPPDQ